ncbi:hypothetical protein [Cohnella boryungensis]|uniref:DUF2304 domain-containing protein n=1 Tax=Cohnella boryungensis TaxID=768479 RepID=A0ABV8SHV0_9BACL
MEMIIIVVIVATYITLSQISYFQNYKNHLNRITVFAIVIWFLALIVLGIISGRANTNFQNLKEDYPIYLIVFITAVTIQLLFSRISKDKNENKDNKLK